MLEKLKIAVCEANIELARQKLAAETWGNVSGIDRESNIVIIKPSGVSYDKLRPGNMVAVDLQSRVVEGKLKPSSDTATHLELYRYFKHIGGICHTHSPSATAWAQAQRPIPCLGTTHADYFYGSVAVTRRLSQEEIAKDYELNTGRVIVECFADKDAMQMPGVLVANHGPFTWGQTPAAAVACAVVLEEIAKTALATLRINPNQKPISQALLDKHFLRKHGKDAYYGQN